jgi:hypothetical protein
MARLGEFGLPFGMGVGISRALQCLTQPVPVHLTHVAIMRMLPPPLPCLRARLFE